jgi:hypothetical protein
MNKLVSVKIALIIGVAAAAVRIASPAFAEEGWVDPFILALRAPAKATDRFGDLPLGAVIRRQYDLCRPGRPGGAARRPRLSLG